MKTRSTQRIFLAFLLVAAMIFSMVSISGNAQAAKKPALNKKSITMDIGKRVTLKITNASGKASWKSSNASVASVKNGTVTAKKAGKAVITCTVKGKKLTCKVTVRSRSTTALYPGQRLQGIDRTISTPEEMNQFVAEANAGNTFAGQTIMLINNINYNKTENNFTPIQNFAGTFNGGGYNIDGIVIKTDGDAGLFINNQGTIKDVYVTGMQIIELGKDKKLGAIVAENNGVVDGCRSEGVMTSVDATSGNVFGGIVGEGKYGTTVRNCMSQMTIDCPAQGADGYCGGIVGRSYGSKVLNNMSLAKLSGKSLAIGGILGIEMENAGELKGNLSMGSYGIGDNIAGIANNYKGTAQNSYFLECSQTAKAFSNNSGSETNVKSVSYDELKLDLIIGKLNDIANTSADLKTWNFNGSYPELPKLRQIVFNALEPKGVVECQRVSAYEGESITINVTPYRGYKVKQLSVITETMKAVASVNGKNSLTFTVPGENVKVSVMYQKK